MKCEIVGQNATILAKAIHSFARIGNELFLEADKRGLSLRTVNITKSAFALISFNSEFFVSFKINPKEENQCKLSMKSCLGVFRNMKQVESCTLSLDIESAKLTVQFKCRLQTVKTHHITILEQESLQAVYFADKMLNTLGGSHKLFSNLVSNFKINEEELSVKATDKEIVAQNYVEGSHVDNRFVRSQITLKPDEFESYKITKDTTVTFCMRELRAILNFAESMNISVSANFDTAGKPIVFILRNFETFEANLVMSTLTPEDEEYERERSRSQASAETNTQNVLIGEQQSEVDEGDENASNDSNIQRKRTLSNHNSSSLFNFGVDRTSALEVVRKKRRTSNENHSDTNIPPAEDLGSTNHAHQLPPNDLMSEAIEVEFQDDSVQNVLEDGDGVDMEIDNPANQNRQRQIRDHRPIVRQMFQRCFTNNSQCSQNYGDVLVDCSDEEM